MVRPITPEAKVRRYDELYKKSVLTEREIAYCHSYAKDFDQTKAAIAAGFDPSRANRVAAKYLGTPRVIEYLNSLTGINEHTILANIFYIATTNISDLVEWDDEDVQVKNSAELTIAAKSSIKSIKITKKTYADGSHSRTVDVELHDKLKALDMMMKALRLYPKHNDFSEFLSAAVSENWLTPMQADAIYSGFKKSEEELKALNHTHHTIIEDDIKEAVIGPPIDINADEVFHQLPDSGGDGEDTEEDLQL